MTRGERIIAFIERYCIVPEGRLVGKPMRLLPFQKNFILDVFDNPDGTRVGILSIARKNGKTGLIAAILLAFIAGPEARQNAEIASAALSKDQAALVFELACKMINLSPELSRRIRIVPSGKRLYGLTRNVKYQALAADAGTAHGKSPFLLILDELGQVRGETNAFVEALETAQGAYDDPLKLIISTQAATDADMLSLKIDDALRSEDPHTVCHLYCADEDADLMDEAQWLKANPAMGVFRSKKDVEEQAKKAVRMPSDESGFMNLILNMRVNRNNPFVSPTVWKHGNRPVDDSLFYLTRVWCALDLSKTTDLTAFVMVAQDEEGNWHVKPRFWKAIDTLADHERRDKAGYTMWARQGFLHTTPGASIQYSFVAEQIAALTKGVDVQVIGFDRWKFEMLKPHLEAAGLPEGLFQEVIQGPRTFSPFLDSLESLLILKKIIHDGHPVMTMCAANAVVVPDANENRRLDKAKSTGRIDGMVALAMAIGLASQAATGHVARASYLETGALIML